MDKMLKIAVAGTGYVGLSIATLLAQHHEVCAIDVIPAKVDLINRRKSPIRDEYIEKYLAEKELKLTATLDPAQAYSGADFVVIAAPTNYDSRTQHFDTSAVEAVIQLVMRYNPNAVMVIKSTIPVGYTVSVREKFGSSNIIFSPEFLRESKALYDNNHTCLALPTQHRGKILNNLGGLRCFLAAYFGQFFLDIGFNVSLCKQPAAVGSCHSVLFNIRVCSLIRTACIAIYDILIRKLLLPVGHSVSPRFHSKIKEQTAGLSGGVNPAAVLIQGGIALVVNTRSLHYTLCNPDILGHLYFSPLFSCSRYL